MVKHRGFTLIELMIVVAIIGILAAIAIPAYQDYTVRAKVTEALYVVSVSKNSIVEYYLSNQNMPTQTVAGITNTSTDIISSVTLTRDGTTQATLSVSFKSIGGDVSSGDNLKFVATGYGANNLVGWECSTTSTLAAKYRPSSCR